MGVELSSPDGLLRQPLYHHVAMVTGGHVVCMAGQVGVDRDGRTVAADFGGQVLAALRGVVTGMGSVGSGPEDLVRLTVYVVDWNPSKVDELETAFARAQTELGLPSPLPPLTVIGVQALYQPELLVKIEAMAVTA